MTANEFFSETSPVVAAIRREMARGKKARNAMDLVCGEGSYEKFAREIYDSIRAKRDGSQMAWSFGPELLGARSR